MKFNKSKIDSMLILLLMVISIAIVVMTMNVRRESAWLFGKKTDEFKPKPQQIEGVKFKPILDVKTHPWVVNPIDKLWKLKAIYADELNSASTTINPGYLKVELEEVVVGEMTNTITVPRWRVVRGLEDTTFKAETNINIGSPATDSVVLEGIKKDSMAIGLDSIGDGSSWLQRTPTPYEFLMIGDHLLAVSDAEVDGTGKYLKPSFYVRWLTHKKEGKEYLIPYWLDDKNTPLYLMLNGSGLELTEDVHARNVLIFEIEEAL